MNANIPSVTLSEAKTILKALAHEQSVPLLSPPGIGKTDAVHQAAANVGLPCRSLLGTQLAPEDISGIPRYGQSRRNPCQKERARKVLDMLWGVIDIRTII